MKWSSCMQESLGFFPFNGDTWKKQIWVHFFLLFQAEIFQEFTIKEDLVGFQVNLTVLLDCLNIFGGSTVPGKETGN